MHCYTQCPQPCSRPPPTHASARDSWTLTGMSGSVSCGVTAPFSCVLVHTRFCLSPLRVYFPVLCKFWQLYGRVNRDLLKGAYAIAKSAAPRAPAPAKSTADPYLHRRYQTQFCLSLVGVSGSWCTEGLFESSELLWWVWGLILRVISPLLLSCWVLPRPTTSPLPLDVGYFLKVSPVPHGCLSSIFLCGVYLEVEFLSPMVGSGSIVLRKAKLFSKVDLWVFRSCNNSCSSINSISQEGWLSNINCCSVFRFSIPCPWQIWKEVCILMIIISCYLVHNKTLPLKYILSFWHFSRSRFLPLV